MALDHLRAELEQARRAKPRTFSGWLETADPEEAELVLEYIKDPSVAADPLMRKLRKNGIPITADTIVAYRKAGS